MLPLGAREPADRRELHRAPRCGAAGDAARAAPPRRAPRGARGALRNPITASAAAPRTRGAAGRRRAHRCSRARTTPPPPRAASRHSASAVVTVARYAARTSATRRRHRERALRIHEERLSRRAGRDRARRDRARAAPPPGAPARAARAPARARPRCSRRRSEMRMISPRRGTSRPACANAAPARVAFPAPGSLERRDDPLPLPAARARRDSGSDLGVEADEPHRVALPQQQERDRRREPLGVGELGEPRSVPAPRHRAADVEQDRRAQIRLLLELLHDEPVRRAPRSSSRACAVRRPAGRDGARRTPPRIPCAASGGAR